MSADPVVLREDGAIMWRECFMPPDQAAKLAEQFESVGAKDWFYPTAQSYAIALRKAIQEQAECYAD